VVVVSRNIDCTVSRMACKYVPVEGLQLLAVVLMLLLLPGTAVDLLLPADRGGAPPDGGDSGTGMAAARHSTPHAALSASCCGLGTNRRR
jgi:hypothetical protein